jgi:hypothetical protein
MVHATADTSTTDPESRLLPSQQFRLTVARNDMARAEALLARVPSREDLLYMNGALVASLCNVLQIVEDLAAEGEP